MDKALRNTIIAGIIIIALSVSYYLVIFIPKKEAMRIEQQRRGQESEALKEQKIKEELDLALDKCFSEADERKIESLKKLCSANSKEIGSDGLCEHPLEIQQYLDDKGKDEKDICIKRYSRI